MVIYDQIIQHAKHNKKNILIIGSPRSGTHALGAELAKRSGGVSLGEICTVTGQDRPWEEITQLYNTDQLTNAQIVQLTAKLYLARDVDTIKKHVVIVNLRRRNKVKQFASYYYFRFSDPTCERGWHNHSADQTNTTPGSVEVTESDITQFMSEQLIDDYFLPDFNLCYEDLTFSQTKYWKNTFAFPLENMFSNLDYVKQTLEDWKYSTDHFKNA